MVNVINLLFGDVSNASEEMDKVFELETKIAKIMRMIISQSLIVHNQLICSSYLVS